MAAVPEATLNTGGLNAGGLGALKPQLGNKLLLIAGIAAVAAVMVVVWLWSRQPDYRVLFSNFADKDGGSIVASPSIGAPGAAAPGKLDFAQALKSSLDQVNAAQVNADTLGKNFVMGDDRTSLSDVMISMQKANISFQATVQVRNKLVAAYHDMMNMQV